MSNQISIRYLEPSEYERWDHFVDTTRLGTIYSQSFFLSALCQAFGTNFRILAAFKNDELVGGIGLHYRPSKYGNMVHIRPLLYYNGLVISDFESKYPSITSTRQTEVVRAILDELGGGQFASTEISSTYSFNDFRPFVDRGWTIWPRYTYIVPIADLEKQWEHAEQNIRRLISRCERDGMKLELSDDMDAFYSMNKETYERKGVKPYASRDTFTQLYCSLKERNACQIYFAVTPDGQRAAGEIVLFTQHPVTHTWMAGSNSNFLQSGASAFLRWKAFEDLSRRGYKYNDLTDAMIGKVAKFKSQFGGSLESSFVMYREFSSRLRLENRIRNLLRRPMNSIKARFNKASSSVEEVID
jgi:hypothetical protein